jgi:hypothetical protein
VFLGDLAGLHLGQGVGDVAGGALRPSGRRGSWLVDAGRDGGGVEEPGGEVEARTGAGARLCISSVCSWGPDGGLRVAVGSLTGRPGSGSAEISRCARACHRGREKILCGGWGEAKPVDHVRLGTSSSIVDIYTFLQTLVQVSEVFPDFSPTPGLWTDLGERAVIPFCTGPTSSTFLLSFFLYRRRGAAGRGWGHA